MRTPTFAILITAVATITAASPSRAQTYDPRYPVCMYRIASWGGEYYDCSFTSLPQCRATASGLPAQCIINPYFAGAAGPAGRAWRRAY